MSYRSKPATPAAAATTPPAAFVIIGMAAAFEVADTAPVVVGEDVIATVAGAAPKRTSHSLSELKKPELQLFTSAVKSPDVQ